MFSPHHHYKCDNCNLAMINGTFCHETGCHGVMRLTYLHDRKKRERGVFEVWSLDVYGNQRDGFEVNDRSKIGSVFSVVDDDNYIIKSLKRADIINKKCHYSSFSIDGDERSLYVDYKGKPLLQLERL
jgi:hypothetical protein